MGLARAAVFAGCLLLFLAVVASDSEMKLQSREVTWNNLELTGLLEDEESRVHFTRTIKHLALHPYHLNNVQKGLNQILKSSLNSYDRELKGFVLAVRNPKLLSNLGEVLYDSPFIHVDIEADFYLFRPIVGSVLKGIVKKKGLDHIVVLVHKIYTVSIPKPDDIEEWLGDLVEIDQEVKCCVSHIDNRSRLPFICATLRSNYSQGCKLSESMNNIDNVDSAIESMNTTIKINASANGISEDDSVPEKEKKKHRKKHKKSRDNDSNFDCKVENDSESNSDLGNTSKIIKSEKKRPYESIQDTMLNNDDSSNTLEVDNIPKKHKKSKKTKSLVSDDTILDEHTESRKGVKRENSIPLDHIIETETKKKKKHAKKSREFNSDPENEKEVINNTENTIPVRIKSEEEEHTHKKHIISNADLSSNNVENSISKKHKKNKKVSTKMSDSESDHFTIKIEKRDPSIDRIINESQTSYSETQIEENLNETLEMPKFVKREVSIEYDSLEKERKKSPKKYKIKDSQLKSVKIKNEDDTNNDSDTSDKERKKSPKKHTIRDSQLKSIKIKTEDDTNNDSDTSDKERKKSPKKHTIRDSQLKSIKIKNEDDTNNVSDTSDKERKKSPKKHANTSRDLDSQIKIKTENITNDIFRTIKRDPEESQYAQYNTSAVDINLDNSDLDRVSTKSKKKKTSTILSDSEHPVKVKIEKV